MAYLGSLPRPARKQYLLAVFALVLISVYLFLPTVQQRSHLSRLVLSQKLSSWTQRQQKYALEGPLQELPPGRPYDLPSIQHKFARETAEATQLRESRLQAIKDSFSHSWNGYRKHAWLNDELSPMSGGAKNTFGNWSATLVDSLDSLWIMGFYDEFEEAVQAVAGIDFETSTSKIVSVFETTIRYLGGLLSAYDLSGNNILLEKAWNLGNMLYAAFDTPSRMPVPYWDWKNAFDGGDQTSLTHAVSADIGSLSMEFTRLSQLTGDPKFFDAIQRISDIFAEQQKKSIIPGLWPVFVDAVNKDFASGNEFSMGALSDSLYEYMPKMHILLGGRRPEYGQMYQNFADAAKRSLFFKPMNPQNRDILFSGVARTTDDGIFLQSSSQHLACFVGGMMAIGGKTLQRDEDIEAGRRLADGCVWAYESSPSGIMPEIMDVVPCPVSGECTWSEKTWHDAVLAKAGTPEGDPQEIIKSRHLPPGFIKFGDGRYQLRPEAIESVFIMYRITGDAEWQEKAWWMYTAIEKHTRTDIAYAALENVAVEEPKRVDKMESFWTAETLKYFYLTFSDPELISLDDYVFNTEAHPLKRPQNEKWWSWS